MSTKDDLQNIFAAARPLVEQALDLTEQFAALRDAATEKGLDWSQIKALVKAAVQDERNGDTDKVGRIIEKADFASAYADMLGLKMNENNFSAETDTQPEPQPAPPEPPAERSPPIRPRPSVESEPDLDIPDFLDRRSEARAS